MSDAGRRLAWQEHVMLRGVRHRLTWWGERTGNPVVLLHGWMDSGATWQFLVDCLPADWTCVALDWRGFGGSEWPAQGYWFPDYFADLETLLDVVCPGEPARLVGHSMGGNVASLYAGIRPGRVRWLVNLEGVGLPRTSPADAPARYAEWLDQLRMPPRERHYASLDVLVDFILARNPRLPKARAEFLARSWSCPQKKPDSSQDEARADAAQPERVSLVFDPRHRIVSPILYRREEAEACWRRVKAPVLLLLGELSGIRQRLGADVSEEYFRTVFHDIRVAVLPGVGHMMHLEVPETIARLIVGFAV